MVTVSFLEDLEREGGRGGGRERTWHWCRLKMADDIIIIMKYSLSVICEVFISWPPVVSLHWDGRPSAAFSGPQYYGHQNGYKVRVPPPKQLWIMITPVTYCDNPYYQGDMHLRLLKVPSHQQAASLWKPQSLWMQSGACIDARLGLLCHGSVTAVFQKSSLHPVG